jgi:hypothetical protein
MKTAKISTVLELPGAIFYGDAIHGPVALDTATRRQAIRADYEATDCITKIRLELEREGFTTGDIGECAMSPAKITDCGYGWPTVAIQ